ncbi:MAG: hypothetical protein QM802_07200 [Agriterribacter sp.]
MKQKILSADSVLLISHELTLGYATAEENAIGDTSMPPDPPAPEFFINGKLNRAIINEQALLTDTARLDFIKILLRPVNIEKYTPTKCDQPRHSIIFYKNDQQSYIDICFGCMHIHSSADINFFEHNMDQKKWEQLMNFFKRNGVGRVLKEMDE